MTVLPGAEPFSAPGGPHGALVLHGFTGCPQSMRGLAEAFASAGFAVELPRLPGHGTSVEDMMTTTWADWSAAVERAYRGLAARCEKVVVSGLSMGGTLTLWLAARHPEIAGVIVINAVVVSPGPGLREDLRQRQARGVPTVPGVGNDVADPGAKELAYDAAPVEAMLSLLEALEDLQPRLGQVACPTLVMTSPQDHVVPASQSDTIAASVSGPVERLTLARSYHVATIDHDKGEIERRAVVFARKVTGLESAG